MTQLYRHFDAAGTCLYIGIAEAASARQMAHARNAGWMRDVRTITVSAPFRTRADALAAEAEAIRTEHPKWNQQHAENPVKPPTPFIILTALPGAMAGMLWMVMRRGGTLVSSLFGPDKSAYPNDITVHYIQLQAKKGDLEGLARRAASGELQVEIGRTYDFVDGAQALADLRDPAKHTRGKLIVRAAP
jgi:hypothetical protein